VYERLHRDGARWRAEVDGQQMSAPAELLDRITDGPADEQPAQALRDRFPGRPAMLLSVAAVTVLAVAVGGGVAALTGRHDPHPTPSALAATAGSPAASTVRPVPTVRPVLTVPPVPSASSKASGRPVRSTPATPASAHRSTAARHHRHRTTARTSAATAVRRTDQPVTTTSPPAEPLLCEPAELAISVSAPTATVDQATLTVSVMNNGAAPCTISGFPTVQFSGDSTVTAAATDETPGQVTLASGASATAEVTWNDASATGVCASYPTALVAAPGGVASEFPLDPPAQVCDGSTFVVHPLTVS
jgi:hypothetical protein